MIGLEADKSFAYLLGVYLGDGSVSSNRYSQSTIDNDFKDAVIKSVALISKARVAISYVEVPRKNTNCSPAWYLSFADRVITDKLVADTNKKQVIPSYVFSWNDDLKKQFIVGLMDSEGFVARNHGFRAYKWKQTNRSYYMGYKSCDVWVDDLMSLMQSVGLRLGKCGVESNARQGVVRKPSKRFHIKMQSWVDTGMKFNIARKQSRVDEWASIGPYERRAKFPRRLISETSTPEAIHG